MGAKWNVNIIFANISSTLTLATLIFPHFLLRYWLDTIQFKLKKHRLISHPWKAMPTVPTLLFKTHWFYYYRPSKCTLEPPKTFFVPLLTIFIEYLQAKTEISKPGLEPWAWASEILSRAQAHFKPSSGSGLAWAWTGWAQRAQGLRPSPAHH